MDFVRRHFFPVWCGTLVVAVLLLSVGIGKIVRSSVDKGEERACTRLNIVRASQNRTNRDAFAFDSIELHLVEASILKQTASVQRTAAQRQATEQFLGEKQVDGHFVGLSPPSGLNGVVADLDWIALTNCHAAIHDSAYKPPSSVLFSVRPPPPNVFDDSS